MEITIKELDKLIQTVYELGYNHSLIKQPVEEVSIQEVEKSKPIKVEVSDKKKEPMLLADFFNKKYQQAKARKDVSWFIESNNATLCFYYLSKAEIESHAGILIPYIVEHFNDVFGKPISRQDLIDRLSNLSWIQVNLCHYRSIDIMLYKCFNFITWENKRENKLKVFYTEPTAVENEKLRQEGYEMSAAILDFLVNSTTTNNRQSLLLV